MGFLFAWGCVLGGKPPWGEGLECARGDVFAAGKPFELEVEGEAFGVPRWCLRDLTALGIFGSGMAPNDERSHDIP